MFNGFRSEAFLDNFNAPANAGITATGGTVSVFPANPRTNLIKSPLTNGSGIQQYNGFVQDTGVLNGTNSRYYIVYQVPANAEYYNCNAVFNLDVSKMQSGQQYTFSIFANIPYVPYKIIVGYDYMGNPIYGYTNNSAGGLGITEYNNGSSTGTTITPVNSTGGLTTKISGTFTYNGGTSAYVSFGYVFRNNQSASYSAYIQSPIVELGTSTDVYFSGDTVDCHWNGAQYNSTSSQNQYKVHTFTSNGNFDITGLGSAYNSVEYLVVAGGGAGGNYNGGGGGAGGMLTNVGGTPLQVSLGSYPVVVGNGGVGTAYPNPGGNGENSSVLGLTAIGGGGGGAPWGNGTNNEAGGRAGGSGGGAGYNTNYIASGGAGTAGQGNKGGDGAI